jgi:hypothetical protein
MAFRQRRSTWPGASAQSQDALRAIGVPDAALCSATHFVEYLTEGVVRGSGDDLNDLSDDHFWELFDRVSSWYDMELINFKAFESRRLRTLHKS